jgi:protein-disulfide isomerase
MTHYEKKEHQESKHENYVPKEHHVGNKHEHKKKTDSCCGTNLNSFQKFLVVAVIIQISLLLFVAVKISTNPGINVNDNNNAEDVLAPSAAPSANNAAPSVDLSVLIDDDAVKGDENAPVTIVEFSDYECPFCEKFYTQTLQQIEEKYVETGKVKFVYRDFPLGFHQNAQKAAEAAECAGEQDKYFEMHDLLFEKGVSGGVNSFKQYAQELNLDPAKFNQCLDSGAMASEVKKDLSAGAQLGVSGTPAFFINDKKLVGAQPFQAFEQIIEQELNS